jgi:dephospho-CoA kinase
VLKIGLTGGIGCGKTTVAKYFSKLKVSVVDADKIAHELLARETATYKKIVTHFGREYLTKNKLINRKKLAGLIFANKKERIWLEKLLHPHIRSIINKRLSKIKTIYCIVVLPLLFETKYKIKTDRVLVVDCPQKTQIKRIRVRDKRPVSEINKIIKTQAGRGLRLKRADDIISNDSSLKHLERIVKKLHSHYLSLS